MSYPHSTNNFSYKSSNRTYNLVLMSRDPKCIYAYWDIANENINRIKKDFSPETFEKSSMALKVNNLTQNYSFYIYLNSYADSWYIDVEHPGCTYSAEIGLMVHNEYFICLACSNCVWTPYIEESSNKSVYFADYNDMKYLQQSPISSHCIDSHLDDNLSSQFFNLPSSADLMQKENHQDKNYFFINRNISI